MYLRKETQIKGVLQALGLGLAWPSLSLLFSLVTGEAPLRAPAGASTHSSRILPAEGGAAHSTLKLQVFAVKRIPLVLFFFFLKLTSPNLKSKVNIALVPGQLLR